MKKEITLSAMYAVAAVVSVASVCWISLAKFQPLIAADSGGQSTPPGGIYASAPTPLNTGNYLLGAYFFPYWHSPGNSITNWLLMNAYYSSQTADHADIQNRKVLLNANASNFTFPEEQPWALDYDISWALGHGIKYYIFDWYWGSPSSASGVGKERTQIYISNGLYPGSVDINDGLHSFLKAKYNRSMLFTLMLASQPKYQSEAAQMVDSWSQYFSRPNYLFINNEPVVVVGANLANTFGASGTLTYLQNCRTEAKRLGYPGIYFIASETFTGTQPTSAQGYQALTDYGLGGAGEATGTKTGPYNNLVTGFTGQNGVSASADTTWAKQQGSSPYLVPLTSDFDDRPRPPAYQLGYRTNATPGAFMYQLLRAKEFADHSSHTSLAVRGLGTKKMFTIYAWNEISEGGILMPTAGNGFSYLNSIRSVFGQGVSSSHQEAWIQNGVPTTATNTTIFLATLQSVSNPKPGAIFHNSDTSWTNYQVTAVMTPQFADTTHDQHFGLQVWKNGNDWIEVFVRKTGVFARGHTAAGYVGTEHELLAFSSNLASGSVNTLRVEAWHGVVNVLWNGALLPPLNLPKSESPLPSMPQHGGVEIASSGMSSLKIGSLNILSLNASYEQSAVQHPKPNTQPSGQPSSGKEQGSISSKPSKPSGKSAASMTSQNTVAPLSVITHVGGTVARAVSKNYLLAGVVAIAAVGVSISGIVFARMLVRRRLPPSTVPSSSPYYGPVVTSDNFGQRAAPLPSDSANEVAADKAKPSP